MPGPSSSLYLLQGRPQKNFHMEACFKCGKASHTEKTALHFKAVARLCPDWTTRHWGIDCPTFLRQGMSLFPNYYFLQESLSHLLDLAAEDWYLLWDFCTLPTMKKSGTI